MPFYTEVSSFGSPQLIHSAIYKLSPSTSPNLNPSVATSPNYNVFVPNAVTNSSLNLPEKGPA
jgi:hypothetical protein